MFFQPDSMPVRRAGKDHTMKKKLLALLLCVLMTVTLLPSLTAAENDGSEEESPEFVILDEETPELDVPEEETPESEQPESDLFPEDAAPIDVQKPEDNGSRQDIVDSGMLQMGTNTFVISNGGDRLFKWFVAPASGKFRIFSYGNFDTVGNINGGSVSAENDDGGTSTNFLLECTLERGEWYMVGAWFYTSTTTGTINVMIDFVSDPLQVGSNTFAITYDGEEVCRSFTASNSGEYRFYDTCSYGYLNYRLLNDKMITLDTQSEYTAYNFDIRYMLNAGQTVYLAVSPAEVNSGNFSAYNVNVNIEYLGSSATPTPTPTVTPEVTEEPTAHNIISHKKFKNV